MESSQSVFWVPDSEAPYCSLCKVRFGVITRRHHCRACGQIFCHQCSSHKLRLPDLGFQELVRVCLICQKKNSLEDLWESDSFVARYYLRLQPGFSFCSPLFEVSRRDAREKSMFLVQDSNGTESILSLISRGQNCTVPYLTSDSARSALKRLLSSHIRHPFIWPIIGADFLEDSDKFVLLQPFSPKGSLRDLLHKANPKGVYGEKYKRTTGSTLYSAEIALYSRQILDSLLYLSSRNFRISNLHSGNIIVDKKGCHLSGLENELLGLPGEFPPSDGSKQSPEVLGFGRVLFEMVTGHQLRTNQIAPFLEKTSGKPFSRILHLIFGTLDGGKLSLQDLVQMKPFSDVQLVADVSFIHQPPLDARCQRLIDQVFSVVKSEENSSDEAKIKAKRRAQKKEKKEKKEKEAQFQEASAEHRKNFDQMETPTNENKRVTKSTQAEEKPQVNLKSIPVDESKDTKLNIVNNSSLNEKTENFSSEGTLSGMDELLSAIRGSSLKNLKKTGLSEW